MADRMFVDMPNARPIRTTLGAFVLGGFISVFLSGIVAMQVYLYYRVYSKDRLYMKAMVVGIWALDFVHSVLGCVANWTYLIEGFGDRAEIDHIHPSIAAAVTLTATVTFIVHCFFIHRIHLVSKGNVIFTLPLALLALARLVAASISCAEMVQIGSFSGFFAKIGYVFTLGLSLAVVVDVLIMGGLSYYLRKSKSGFSTMNDIIDTLVLYTIESGMATCVVTIASLICWVTMPSNFIWLGLHFTISKLYANSFLATLNSRATLRARSQSSCDRERDISLPVFLSDMGRRATGRSRAATHDLGGRGMQISVTKTIQQEVDGEITNVDLDGEPSHLDRDDYSCDTLSALKGKGEPSTDSF